MPNTISYTHTHTHAYTGTEDRCDCGSTEADTRLRGDFGIEVKQTPGIEIWTITRADRDTDGSMFTDYNTAMTAANELTRKVAKNYMRE